MQLSISGQFTNHELREAITLNWRTLRRLSAIGVITIASVMLLGLLSSDNLSSGFSSSIPLLVLGIMISYPFYLPHFQAARMGDSAIIQHPISGTINEQALIWSVADSDMELTWQALQNHKRTETMILLYQGNGAFTPFPRMLFGDDADWQTFQTYVITNTPPRDDLKARVAIIVASLLAVAMISFALYNTFFI